MPPPPRAAGSSTQTIKKIVSGVVVGVLGIAIAIGGCWAYGHPSIHVINTTAASGLTIFVDGESVTGKLASSTHETPGADESASVSSGEHTLVAKDSSGKVIDTQKVTIESGFGKAYLYAPAHPSSVCFVLQTDAYGTAKVANPYQHLDRTKSFWSLPKSPDYWFKDTPNSVKVKNSSGTTKSSLRQITCGDRNFEE